MNKEKIEKCISGSHGYQIVGSRREVSHLDVYFCPFCGRSVEVKIDD